jgi:hypothetical protein
MLLQQGKDVAADKAEAHRIVSLSAEARHLQGIVARVVKLAWGQTGRPERPTGLRSLELATDASDSNVRNPRGVADGTLS